MATVSPVNNAFYDELGDRWYDDDAHAVALLRAESRLKLDYVKGVLSQHGVPVGAKILDVACGAGFLSLPLARAGFEVTGIDLSEGSLQTARRRATGLPVTFRHEDALALSAADASFDAVLILDFLEHVSTPAAALAEAARVLKPGGVLIFHTFNRTLAARLLAIKAIEMFTRDCPPHLHVYELFIKPSELGVMARDVGLRIEKIQGLRPDVFSWPFIVSVLRRRMHPDFGFCLTRSKAVGYVGYAIKEGVARLPTFPDSP